MEKRTTVVRNQAVTKLKLSNFRGFLSSEVECKAYGPDLQAAHLHHDWPERAATWSETSCAFPPVGGAHWTVDFEVGLLFILDLVVYRKSA